MILAEKTSLLFVRILQLKMLPNAENLKITAKKMDKSSISLCSPRLRSHFKKFTERNYPSLFVLSYNEVIPQAKVQSIGVISADSG